MLFGSVTELQREAHSGVHAVVGSHGGVATGRHALSVEVASLVVHDAGFGLDDAGIAALKILESKGIPAAAAGHDSARIGDAEDVLARGIVSACNARSRRAGVVPGMTVAEAHTRMVSAGSGSGRGDSATEPSFHMEELAKVHECRIWLLDSASMITAEMAGGIAITGSHGGLPGGSAKRAAKADVKFCVFNDAGIGRDEAGISRLSPLDTRNIPAACVEAASARIGEAASTYATGRISRVNNSAHLLGVRSGQSVQAAILALLAAHSGASSH
ncbi:hypothetical protein [Phaeobacter sp. 22II1-1F12B]|uniref:hypothetical protein n=1 Tax=Phaeobacter sp. 22II1-1F12B TaxID=1317111 RepID=UPI001185CD17|nr:hypothetical protein [Phaeobacter sp. 22II1-1F12B]